MGKALQIDRPDNASAHCALGVLRMYSESRRSRHRRVRARSLAIDRNLAVAHAWIGVAVFLAGGRNEETERHVLEALRHDQPARHSCIWLDVLRRERPN